ncbi:MAG: M23 family metallopeptidase [Candidatus Omnitrophica bacterium]|nr:M23 family metallopeptidase [Candidatus Omnitrophota bacterium]
MKFARKIPLFLLGALSGLVVFRYVLLPAWITHRVQKVVAREWRTPLDTGKRADWDSLIVTRRGGFLADRTAYAHLRVHIHTGVDLQNRHRGGPGEPVYAVAKGKVHDVRIQAQGTRVTVRHLLANGEIVYTSYIHVGGVRARKGQWVDPATVIARRFDRDELKKYGQFYNHLHFQAHKARFVPEHTINTNTREEAKARFYDPKFIFNNHLQELEPDWRQWVRDGIIPFWRLVALLV